MMTDITFLDMEQNYESDLKDMCNRQAIEDIKTQKLQAALQRIKEVKIEGIQRSCTLWSDAWATY